MTIAKPKIVRDGEPGNVIVQLPDGTEVAAPIPLRDLLAVEPYTHLEIATHLDAVTVCQIAVYRLLQTMVMVSIDLTKLLDDGREEYSKPFLLERIFFDWPAQDDKIDPMPSAAILAEGETSYENATLGVDLDVETEGRFGEGTVLRPVREVQQPISVVVWCAHKEERRAVRAAFERVFAAEPEDQREGRHVVVPEYFDQTVLVDLDTANPAQDGPADAQENAWAHRVNLTATVTMVQLVGTPPRSRIHIPHPEVGPDVVPD